MEEKLMFVANVLKVALGLGFVIFLHELGHFLLAKWNGVKVEKFSIGFGPTLASFRRGVGVRIGAGSRPPGPEDPPTIGETEYLLAALPLGGYVKMLGESGDDGQAAGAPKTSDPRAYHNKSVFARMQIITAGVILNVVLGVACFAFAFSQGRLAMPARIGGVLAGSPAYKAGLRAGDEIVAIDGRRDVVFDHLLARVKLSSSGEKITFTVKSPGPEGERGLVIEPKREENADTPTIGVYPSSSLELFAKVPFRAPPGEDFDKARPLGGFEEEDMVVAVGPEGGPLVPVVDHDDFLRKTEPLRDRPLAVQVARKAPKDRPADKRTLETVTVPPHRFVDFGFRLADGPIVAIRAGSPAEKAGLKPGDRIVAVDGRKDYDPMRLPDDARASAGRPMTLSVERAEGGKPAPVMDLTIIPDASPIWVDPVDPLGRFVPLDVPGLGLAIAVEPTARAVREGSPAAKAGLKPGDSLRSMTVTLPKLDKATPKPVAFQFDGKTSSWPMAFALLQDVPWSSVAITLTKSDKPIPIQPEVVADWYRPLRGLGFQGLTRRMPPLGLAESFRRGLEETYENVVNIFAIFKGLYQGRVGADAMGGAIPIAQIAYATASSGLTPFIHFLGILSINLAVLNFLPIPPLDGGQFAFLAAEKVRGKPLPEGAVNVVTIAGIVFVLGLILFINGKDIVRLVQS